MELDTAVRNKSNICIIISNNAAWNIETHDQRLNYGNRVYGTTLKSFRLCQNSRRNGCISKRVENPEELESSISEALKTLVVDVITFHDCIII